MFIKCVGAFFAVVTVGVIFRVPKNLLIHGGITGAFGWLIYLLVQSKFSALYAVFLATLAIAFISHFMARITHSPVIMFLIPGIIPLVPGAGMYYIAYSFIYNQEQTGMYFMNTIQTAGAIALAIFLVDTVMMSRRMPNITQIKIKK